VKKKAESLLAMIHAVSLWQLRGQLGFRVFWIFPARERWCLGFIDAISGGQGVRVYLRKTLEKIWIEVVEEFWTYCAILVSSSSGVRNSRFLKCFLSLVTWRGLCSSWCQVQG
jgi:hypothetical protein